MGPAARVWHPSAPFKLAMGVPHAPDLACTFASVLRSHGIETYVIHSASVSVSREQRRAKTDRLDTERKRPLTAALPDG